MFKFNKNLSLFKSARLVFEGPETPEPHAAPESEDPALTPAEHKAQRAETTKAILEGVKQDRAALSNKQATALTLKTKEDRGDKLLMEDTYVLIAQRGAGSKHNERGWKGLASSTDSVKVLDYKVKLINGVEMVKVKLSHKLYSKPGAKDRYRTYIGYIPKKSFDPSVRLRAPEPEDRKWKERPEESEPKPIDVNDLTADFFLKHGAKSVNAVPHTFAIFDKTINCNLELLYGAGIYDRLLVKVKQDPKTQNPILEVYSPINIETQYNKNPETRREIAFLGNFLPTTDNIKNFVRIMKAHKQKLVLTWEKEMENLPKNYDSSPEELKARKIYVKFAELFKRYPVANATTSTSFKGTGAMEAKTYTIQYGKNRHNQYKLLVNIDIDASKEPFLFTINGQHTRSLDATLQFAESILKREVG